MYTFLKELEFDNRLIKSYQNLIFCQLCIAFPNKNTVLKYKISFLSQHHLEFKHFLIFLSGNLDILWYPVSV